MKKKVSDSLSKLQHPVQPAGKDADGTVRFKENTIVRYILDLGRSRGIFDLNTLQLIPFPDEDWLQFWQLLGYSLCGFKELLQDKDETYDKIIAAALAQAADNFGD